MKKRDLISLALGLGLLALLGVSFGSRSEETLPTKPLLSSQHHAKIESTLLTLAQNAPQLNASTLTPRMSAVFEPSAQAVRVVIEPQDKTQSISDAQLRAVGAIVEARSRSFLRVRLPIKNLRALADRVQNVRFIRRALPMISSVIDKASEGVVATGASLFHSQGFRGQRVKVAIIDLGFSQLAKAKQNGTLPFNSVIDEMDYSGSGLTTGTAHGTAVAEVVHDMAPEAWLYLKKATDEVELEQAVDDAIEQGVQIINYSVGVANSNFNDGTGIIDEIVDRAHSAGILWVNAAGNHAQSHWMGSFIDRDRDSWNEFETQKEALTIQVQSFFPIQVYLTWDGWPTTADDFDLFLYDAAGNLVSSSQDYQTGREHPTEELEYMPQGVGDYYLKILARHNRTPGIRFNLFVFGEHPLNPYVAESSILAPADAKGALAVGAISARNWKTGPQEDYSSQGPTFDGRVKPDISGPDQVTNWALFNFGGTSASAPHVAGAAAVLLSHDPSLTPDEIKNHLESSAIEIGKPGKDNIYGAGRLELSFGPIRAFRQIREVSESNGRQFEVEISLEMPIGLFGAVELIEQVQNYFSLTPLENQGAQFKKTSSCSTTPCPPGISEYRWFWILGSGETRKIRYQLNTGPYGVPVGLYSLVGSVNGETTQGDKFFRVTRTPVSNAQIELKTRTAAKTSASIRMLISQQRSSVRLQAQGVRPESLEIFVYDLSGKLCFNEERSSKILEFSGLDKTGRRLPNGIYFYLVKARDRSGQIYQSRLERFVLMR
jgi:hypothetical protein